MVALVVRPAVVPSFVFLEALPVRHSPVQSDSCTARFLPLPC